MKLDTKIYSYLTLVLNILASIQVILIDKPGLFILFVANASLILLYLIEDKK